MGVTDGELTVTPSNIESVISTSRFNADAPPVWTIGDLAEAFDVTKQTIHNHIDEVEKYPGIRTKKIDRATVYYKDDDAAREDREVNLERDVRAYKRLTRENQVEARAKWLWSKENSMKDFETDGNSNLRIRTVLWIRLRDYVKAARSFDDVQTEIQRVYFEKQEEKPGQEDLNTEERLSELPERDLSGWRMDEDQIEWYLYDAQFFEDTPEGDVNGLSDLVHYFISVTSELQDEKGNVNIEETDDEVLDEHFPTHHELVFAGDLFDRFMTELLNWRW